MTYNLTAAQRRDKASQHEARAFRVFLPMERAILQIEDNPAGYSIMRAAPVIETAQQRIEAERREAALDAVTAHLDALPDDPAFERPAPTEWR